MTALRHVLARARGDPVDPVLLEIDSTVLDIRLVSTIPVPRGDLAHRVLARGVLKLRAKPRAHRGRGDAN